MKRKQQSGELLGALIVRMHFCGKEFEAMNWSINFDIWSEMINE